MILRSTDAPLRQCVGHARGVLGSDCWALFPPGTDVRPWRECGSAMGPDVESSEGIGFSPRATEFDRLAVRPAMDHGQRLPAAVAVDAGDRTIR